MTGCQLIRYLSHVMSVNNNADDIIICHRSPPHDSIDFVCLYVCMHACTKINIKWNKMQELSWVEFSCMGQSLWIMPTECRRRCHNTEPYTTIESQTTCHKTHVCAHGYYNLRLMLNCREFILWPTSDQKVEKIILYYRETIIIYRNNL